MSALRAVAARLALCMSAIAGLLWASRVLPAPPAGLRASAWALWWHRTGPLLALFSVARAVILVALATWMLALVLTALAVMGRAGHRRLSRFAVPAWSRLAALPIARPLLGISAAGALFAGCSSAASSGPGSGDAATGTPSPPVIVNTAPPAAAPATTTTTPTAAPATAPAARSGPNASNHSGTGERQAPSSAVPAHRAPNAVPSHRTPNAVASHRTPNAVPTHRTPNEDRPTAVARPRRADPGTRSWIVRPGDDLWSVAEATVRAAGSPIPVAHYWRELIDANRSRVPDPDLIFPGDVLRLPPVP